MWGTGTREKDNREFKDPTAVMDLVGFSERQWAGVAGAGSKGEELQCEVGEVGRSHAMSKTEEEFGFYSCTT